VLLWILGLLIWFCILLAIIHVAQVVYLDDLAQ
jgi:hypothetical protein